MPRSRSAHGQCAGAGAFRLVTDLAPGALRSYPMPRVRLFANLREIAGTSSVEVDADTIGAVLDELGSRFGTTFVSGLGHARIWKNGEEAQTSDPVVDQDEVAIIPPVSGGAQPTVEAPETFEPLVLGLATLALLGANALAGSAVFAATVVAVASIWAVDISYVATNRGLPVDLAPILASITAGVIGAAGFGLAGLGIGVTLAIVVSISWPVIHDSARELNTIVALTLACIIGALSVGSLILARLSTDGNDKVGSFLMMALAAAAVAWLVGKMTRPIMDQFSAGAVAAIGAGVIAAQVNGGSVLSWLLIGLIVSVSLIAGRAIGSAFRTGEIVLGDPGLGSMAALDGPMLAAVVFLPAIRLIL